MIPTPIEELTEALPLVTDKVYKKLLEEQLTYINNHKRDLYEKIALFQEKYRKNLLKENVTKRCCNFILLEEIFKTYNN